MTRRARPVRSWRAVAYYRLAPGLRAVPVGRCYRRTRRGLDRFIDTHEAAGCVVEVWEVLPHPVIDAAARAQGVGNPVHEPARVRSAG